MPLMRVYGHSMAPRLREGELVVVRRRHNAWQPSRGEIVAARPAALQGRAVVKRVASIEGNEYVLLGDDPADSFDSRQFGSVRRDEIFGAVCWRIWPLHRLTPIVAPDVTA